MLGPRDKRREMASDMRPVPIKTSTLPVRDPDRPLGKVREDAERDHIRAVLQLTDGKRGRAAAILGISRKTLWKKLKLLGLSSSSDVTNR